MSKRDYYDVLGVSKTSSADEIKKSYRKLAMKYHPDRSKEAGAEDKFKEISEAYAVLSDSGKRSQYDQFGHAGFGERFSQEDIFRGANFSGFEDLFKKMGFGGSPFGDIFGFGNRRRADIGDDLQTSLEVELEEVQTGIEKEVDLHRQVLCKRCNGSKAEPGSKVSKCGGCGGSGQVFVNKRMGPMMFRTVRPCGECRGEGSRINHYCSKCEGKGKNRESEKIKVRVPAGIEDGMNIRLNRMGEAGKDGYGDLYVQVRVREHSKFKRIEDDVYMEVPISFSEASFGTKIKVPTLSGEAELKVESGTQSHTVIRMRGEGIPNLHGGEKGNQLVRVIVQVPKKLTKKQKKLLEELAEEEKRDKGFFERIFG